MALLDEDITMQPHETRVVRVQCVGDSAPLESDEPKWFEGVQSDTLAAIDGPLDVVNRRVQILLHNPCDELQSFQCKTIVGSIKTRSGDEDILADALLECML